MQAFYVHSDWKCLLICCFSFSNHSPFHQNKCQLVQQTSNMWIIWSTPHTPIDLILQKRIPSIWCIINHTLQSVGNLHIQNQKSTLNTKLETPHGPKKTNTPCTHWQASIADTLSNPGCRSHPNCSNQSMGDCTTLVLYLHRWMLSLLKQPATLFKWVPSETRNIIINFLQTFPKQVLIDVK